jgi:hypothetical protein
MRNPLLLLSSFFVLLFFSACHRPYALVQRTPSPRFTSPQNVSAADSSALAFVDKQPITDTTTDIPQLIPQSPSPSVDQSLLASTAPHAVASASKPIARRVQRIETLLHQSAKGVTEQPRPRPKPKSQLRLGNKIRQGLGLPLREELNWWQRIDWKLKASVFVILVAIIFAVLSLGQLALLFGLIGAVLLILGLKRVFKKRRPWF